MSTRNPGQEPDQEREGPDTPRADAQHVDVQDVDVLRLVPQLRRRIWGGDHLPAMLGVEPPPGDEPVGEAWLAYGGSRIAGGPHDGRTFGEVVAEHPSAYVGEASRQRYGPIVPLLVKFLDPAAALSVQVHPDDAVARERHPDSGHLGKTESWRVIAAGAEATVTWGFRRPVEEDELRRALEDGTVEELLRSVPVRVGDVVHNPAGTVHALGAGTRIYELQQASDLTYRMWDHGRVGADGRPRELHVDAALAVADRSGRGDPHPVASRGPDGWTTRVACPFYRLEEAGADRTDAPEAGFDVVGEPDGALHVLTLVGGEGRLVRAGRPELTLSAGQTVAVPASSGRYRALGRGLLLRAVGPGSGAGRDEPARDEPARDASQDASEGHAGSVA